MLTAALSEPAVILDYVRPGCPPTGCAYAAEWHNDGITLTRPLPRRPVLAAGLVFTAAVSLGGACLFAAAFFSTPERDQHDGPATVLVCAALAVFAAVALTHVPTTRPRVLTVSLRDGLLRVTNDPTRLWGLPWSMRRPRGFVTTVGRPDVLRLRIVCNLRAKTWLGLERDVLHGVARAECIWLATQLNAALDRAPSPEPSPADLP
jgi:hypothetical protein